MKKKRGPKTGSEIVPIVADSASKLKEKPRAPSDLNPDERALWDVVIGVHQYDWLELDQVPVLVRYCRHAVAGDQIAKALHRYDDIFEAGLPDDKVLNGWLKLLAAQEREYN